MSFAEDNIRAFQQLITTEPLLFSKYEAELHQLAATFSDDIEKISDGVSNWCACESRPQILEALIKLHDDLDKARLPGTTKPIAPPPPPPPKVSRETLLNAIQESFPNQSK
ncbi:hypothetical protein D0A34_18925 [Microcoleus vaginatus PCC 9802]|uniref:hypothetical protein n=1 Tax=Microcoleus vaginatus TaxID=119532 RepID=UPI00020D2226|nr:hypothetical protein MicvaDRAFT_2239 [Microcoleus vaginatus FGP-2]UNU20676.1 hypothetical protein D0A34_18925 [Microcoleus vaginatus PCC 9802]